MRSEPHPSSPFSLQGGWSGKRITVSDTFLTRVGGPLNFSMNLEAKAHHLREKQYVHKKSMKLTNSWLIEDIVGRPE